MKALLYTFKTLLFSMFVFVTGYTAAQVPPTVVSDSFQSILDHSLPTGFSNPGAVIEVFVPGKWKWNSATGYAISGTTSGQAQSMATPTTRFRVGSITKTMMATCILKLQEDGLLSIEDPISMYLRSTLVTDTIASSGIVKIRHLLNHTSGIANSGANTSCQTNVLTNPLGAHTLEESIYCGASQGELYAPEAGWTYSNTNYSILAMIIENVTGMLCRDYLTQTIITPLGLTNTEIPTTNQITGPHMGCYWNIGSWVDLTIINPTTYTGWADVVSSTADLVTFMEALRNGTIINSNSFTLMGTEFPGTLAYGLGYDLYTYAGVSYDGHYGEVANTSALFFANTSSTRAPNGYYISYNFNVQGADDVNKLAMPIFHYLNTNETNAVNTLEENDLKVSVFPNPASSLIHIQMPETNNKLTLKLMDEVGKIVFTTSGNDFSNFTIDSSSFNRGIYTLTIENASRIEFHKLILN